MQNRSLDPTGLANPCKTHGFMETGPDLDRQEAADCVFGWFWIWTNLFSQYKPGPLACYPDPLLTLGVRLMVCQIMKGDSDSTLKHGKWFKGGSQTVSQERLSGVGGFPIVCSLHVLLYSKALNDFETGWTPVLFWFLDTNFLAPPILVWILHYCYQYHLCSTSPIKHSFKMDNH
jgi:hypothetical protein